jgi:hypothetical protein
MPDNSQAHTLASKAKHERYYLCRALSTLVLAYSSDYKHASKWQFITAMHVLDIHQTMECAA